MVDCEAKMNWWMTKVCILQTLEYPMHLGNVLQFSDMECHLGYAEDWALHTEMGANEALKTIRSYVETVRTQRF